MADDLDNTFHFSQSGEDKFDEKRNHQYKNYEIYDGEENIGGCLLKVKMNEQSPRGEGQIYPDSWFVDENSDILKPVVELVAYETTNEQGKGYGRKGLQEIYKIAQEMGAEGRIEADAAWGAGAFYEHCGFEMPEALQQQNKELEDKLIAQGFSGQELKDKIFEEKGSTFDDGIRFFDPTPENLAKLNKSSNSNEAQTTLENVDAPTQEALTPREMADAAHQQQMEEINKRHQEEMAEIAARGEQNRQRHQEAMQTLDAEPSQAQEFQVPEGEKSREELAAEHQKNLEDIERKHQEEMAEIAARREQNRQKHQETMAALDEDQKQQRQAKEAQMQETPTQEAPTQEAPTQEAPTQEAPTPRETADAAHQQQMEEINKKQQEEMDALKAENDRMKQEVMDEVKQEFDVNTPEGLYGYNLKLFALGLGPKPEEPAPTNNAENTSAQQPPSFDDIKAEKEAEAAAEKAETDAKIAEMEANSDARLEALKEEFLKTINESRSQSGQNPLDASIFESPSQEAPVQDAPSQEAPVQEAPAQPNYKESQLEDGSVFAQELNPNGSIKSERTTKPDGSFNFVIFHENGKVKTSIKNDGKDNFTNEKFSEEGIKIEEVSHQGEEKTRTFFNSDGSVKEVVNETLNKENDTMETVVQEAPVQEAPVQEAPVQETPAQEAPVPEAPVQEAPAPEAPAQEEAKEDTMSIINSQVKYYSDSEKAFYEASLKEFDDMPINQGASANGQEADEASRALYAFMAVNRARNEGLVESGPDNSPEAIKLREELEALKKENAAIKADIEARHNSQEPQSDEKSQSSFARLSAMFDQYKQQITDVISDVHNGGKQEAPAQEAPVPEAPVQEAVAQEAPVQEAPAQEAPVPEAPVQEAVAQEAPIPEAPVQEAPVQEAPAQEAPIPEAPVQEAVAQEAPAQETISPEAQIDIDYNQKMEALNTNSQAEIDGIDAAYQQTLADIDRKHQEEMAAIAAREEESKQKYQAQKEEVEARNEQEAPVQESPVQEAPVQEAPVQEAPVQEAVAQEAPVQESPVQEAPVQEAPVQETPVPEAPVQETPVPEAPAPVQEAPSQSDLNITKLGDGSVIKQEFYDNGNPKGEHITKPDGSFDYVSFHENGQKKSVINNDGKGNFTRESFSEDGIKTEDVKRQGAEETKTLYNQDGSLKEVHETTFDKDDNILTQTVLDDKLDMLHKEKNNTQDGVETTETIQIGKEKIVTKNKEDARTILNKTGREIPPHLKDPNEKEGKTQTKEKANVTELNPLLQQHVADKQNA